MLLHTAMCMNQSVSAIDFSLQFSPVIPQSLMFQEETLSHLKEWLSDPAWASNPTLQLVGGTVYVHEQDYNEALKYTHGGQTLEL